MLEVDILGVLREVVGTIWRVEAFLPRLRAK
jgi:hypothetical protein